MRENSQGFVVKCLMMTGVYDFFSIFITIINFKMATNSLTCRSQFNFIFTQIYTLFF